MNDPSMQRYRDQLLDMRSRLQDEIDHIDQARVQQLRRPGDLSSVPTHNADNDTEGLDVDLAVDATLRDELRAVNYALERIVAGTYGKCERCGKPIAAERLEALPYTPHCIDCGRNLEAEARQSAG